MSKGCQEDVKGSAGNGAFLFLIMEVALEVEFFQGDFGVDALGGAFVGMAEVGLDVFEGGAVLEGVGAE